MPMSELVKLANHDGVGVITVENPPVNALSSTVLNQLESCLLVTEKDPAVQALVLIGGGRTFIAGADISGADGRLPEAHRGRHPWQRSRRRS
jgi:3-hydroxyacyl-CoA dehydrogenase